MDEQVGLWFEEWWRDRLNEDERAHFIAGVHQGIVDDDMVKLLIERRAPIGPGLAKFGHEDEYHAINAGPAVDFLVRQPEYKTARRQTA